MEFSKKRCGKRGLAFRGSTGGEKSCREQRNQTNRTSMHGNVLPRRWGCSATPIPLEFFLVEARKTQRHALCRLRPSPKTSIVSRLQGAHEFTFHCAAATRLQVTC